MIPSTQSSSPQDPPSKQEATEWLMKVIDRLKAPGSGNLIQRLIRGLTPSTCIELYLHNCPTLNSIAHRYVCEHIGKAEMQDQLVAFLNGSSERDGLQKSTVSIATLLKTLSAIKLPESPNLMSALFELAKNSQTDLAERATRVICYRYPKLVDKLTLHSGNLGIRRGLCYSSKPELIGKLIEQWGHESVQKLPDHALGQLITPQTLCKIWRDNADTGLALAQAFGYYDDQLDPPSPFERDALCKLLEAGFMTTALGLQNTPISAVDNLMRALLPWSNGINRTPPEDLNLKDPADQMLFFAAIRHFERLDFSEIIDRNPYLEQNLINPAVIRFSKTNISRLRRDFSSEPERSFNVLECAPTLLTQYIIENASCLLIPDYFQQQEQLQFFNARWRLASKVKRPPGPIISFTDPEGPHLADFRELILPNAPATTTIDKSNSPSPSTGAKSAQLLLEYSGLPELADQVSRLEMSFIGLLPSIGIEIQQPLSQEQQLDKFQLKEMLSCFNIPSPHRPEYYQLIEASFAPAYSYHSHVVAILLLRKLGFFCSNKDLSLHISLGGNLGDNVRYLLFSQQFISPRTNQPIGRKLLSKGFAHLHQDAISPDPKYIPLKKLFRTELRSMRINALSLKSERFSDWIDDIISFQLLGGASCSQYPVLKNIWDRFAESIRSLAHSLGPEFEALLNTDWYEASGDSTASELVPMLEIMRRRKAVKQRVREDQTEVTLQKSFLEIRNQHARAVFEALPKGNLYTETPQLFASHRSGIPFLNPLGSE